MSEVACCRLRQKIIVNGFFTLPEETCGIPDSEIADVLTFDKSPRGRPVVAFRYCPWCGKHWEVSGAIQESPSPTESPDEESGEEWKRDGL